jgi:phosphoribosylanthranilate isomerase
MKVKICGVTSVDAAIACARAGADFVGLNFHPRSVRSIDLERGADIVGALPATCLPVGVFVDRTVDEILACAGRIGLRWVQLHGDQAPSDVGPLRTAGFLVIKAFRLGDLDDIARMSADLLRLESDQALPEAVLIDARGSSGQPGGTGRTIPTEVLARLPRFPSRLILAGGLTPENVADRIRALGRGTLWMVDTASGVESAPGVKDLARVRDFLAATRGT